MHVKLSHVDEWHGCQPRSATCCLDVDFSTWDDASSLSLYHHCSSWMCWVCVVAAAYQVKEASMEKQSVRVWPAMLSSVIKLITINYPWMLSLVKATMSLLIRTPSGMTTLKQSTTYTGKNPHGKPIHQVGFSKRNLCIQDKLISQRSG